MRHPMSYAAEASIRTAVFAVASFVAFVLVGLAPAAGSAATFTSLDLPGFSGDENVISFEGCAADLAAVANGDSLAAAGVFEEFAEFESDPGFEGIVASDLSHRSVRIDGLGFAPIPERSTMLLLATGLGGLTLGGRRRRP